MKSKLTKLVSILLALMLCLVSITGCSTKGNGSGTNGATNSQGGKAPLEKSTSSVELVVAQNADAYTMDPQKQSDTVTGNVLNNIFNALILRAPDMSLKPLLATEWSKLSDTQWKIQLRKGVKFHNGEDFNAHAVKFTFDRLKNPDTKALNGSYFVTIVGCEVIDDYTVKFTTNGLDPIFLARLTQFLILPPKYLQEKGNDYFALNPVGTGPYKFVQWVKDDRVVLEANENYFEGKPDVSKVIFKAVPEIATQIAALQSGQLDILPSIPSDQIKTLESSGKAKIVTTPSARMQMLNFNMDTKLGANRNFRLAVAHAIQRDVIVDSLMGGYGKMIEIPISKVIPNIPDDIKAYPYDLAKAKQYLSDAGYPNGLELTMDCQNGFAPFDKEIAQVIAQQLSKIGVKITVKPNESSTHTNLQKTRKISPIYMLSGNNVWYDIDPQLKAFYHTTGPLSTCTDARIDDLIAKGANTYDEAKRYDIYHKAFEIIRDEPMSIALIQYEMISATSNKVTWKPRPDGRIMISEMKVN